MGTGNINIQIVEQVLRGVVNFPAHLTSAMIKAVIAVEYNISEEDLTSRSRKKDICLPWQIVMYLSRKYTKESLSEIGDTLNKNYATVLHAVRKISELLHRDTSLQGQVKILEGKLHLSQ